MEQVLKQEVVLGNVTEATMYIDQYIEKYPIDRYGTKAVITCEKHGVLVRIIRFGDAV